MELNFDGEIEQLFYKNGKPTVNTHYEIGRHLHIEKFYYAKGFFHQSENTVAAARLLRLKLVEQMRDVTNTTFVGCGSFAGFLLSETVNGLKTELHEELRSSINYSIIDNSETDLTFFL